MQNESRYLDDVLMWSFSFRITMWMRFLYAFIQERIRRKWLIGAWILILMALFFFCIIWLRSRLHEVSCNYRLLLTNAPFRITFLNRSVVTGREICANECEVEIFFLNSAGRERSRKHGINQKTVSMFVLYNFWCFTYHHLSQTFETWNTTFHIWLIQSLL